MLERIEILTNPEVDNSVVQTRFEENAVKLRIGSFSLALRAVGVLDREGQTAFNTRNEVNLQNSYEYSLSSRATLKL